MSKKPLLASSGWEYGKPYDCAADSIWAYRYAKVRLAVLQKQLGPREKELHEQREREAREKELHEQRERQQWPHCTKCSTRVSPDAKFCPECGERTVELTHCRKCGTEFSNEAKFCQECGAKR